MSPTRIRLLPTCKDIRPPAEQSAGGFLFPVLLAGPTMDDAFLAQLRCPLDPDREATLTRDEQQLVCSRCSVRFPIKQGCPSSFPTRPNLPERHCAKLSQLPSPACGRRQAPPKNASEICNLASARLPAAISRLACTPANAIPPSHRTLIGGSRAGRDSPSLVGSSGPRCSPRSS